jgi:hypothetical protein
MEIVEQKVLQLQFVDEEVPLFKAIIKKLFGENKKVGFTKTYNKEERILIESINEQVNKNS